MTHFGLRLASLLVSLAAISAGCTAAPPKAADTVFKQGLEQAEGGNTAEALKTLQKGVSQYPTHVRMRFELARLQYETGEALHLKERKSFRDAAVFMERGQRAESLANRRKGNQLRAQATPYYEAARRNLRYVIEYEENDDRIAWGSIILMRCDVFFEDWEEALVDLDRAIDHGKPTGPLLAQWRNFESGLRDKLRRESRRF